MKFQRSIQSSHTQIAQSQVTYLTSRNEHIWLITKVFTMIENFSFGFYFSYFLINTTQFLSNGAMNILIFLSRISFWLWHHTFWIHFCSKAFSAFLLLEIDIWRAFWHKNKCEEIYRIKSTHVSRSIKTIGFTFMTSLKIYLQ